MWALLTRHGRILAVAVVVAAAALALGATAYGASNHSKAGTTIVFWH